MNKGHKFIKKKYKHNRKYTQSCKNVLTQDLRTAINAGKIL